MTIKIICAINKWTTLYKTRGRLVNVIMKKAIGFSVIICIFLSALTLGAFANDPTPSLLWDFGEDSDIEQFMGGRAAANAVTWEAQDFYHIFTATGNDPYVSIDLSVPDVNQIWWVKARVLNKSYASAIELFGSTSGRGLTGSECTHIPITPNSNEWETVIIYIPDANVETVNNYKSVAPLTETYWEGTVDWIRLDPMWSENPEGLDTGGDMVPGEEIYIDYIAFFPTKEEAEAYMSPAEKAAAEEAAAATDEQAAEEAAVEQSEEAARAHDIADTIPAPQTADLISLTFAAGLFAAGVAFELIRKKR